MPKTPEGPFHVVRHAYNDVTTHYAIYANNEPYLVPPKGGTLSRREARWIVELLNAKLEGKVKVLSREELLAVA